MSALPPLHYLKDLIKEKREKEHWTYKRLSVYLKHLFPSEKGLSVRSLERFCCENEIHKSCRLNSIELDEVVAAAVEQVGPTYGRKTITGLLAANGLRSSEQRVGESLIRVNPVYSQARRTGTARQINPCRYHADYFGHKLHIDQNEKMVMFGVTHCCAVDGFSSKIVGFITLPVKNNYTIYDNLFRPIIMQYGMWDQLRVDQGKEWFLTLFIQEELAHYRGNTNRSPHLQTTSKRNHMVERIWVEVNGRVNYPIKTVLVEMEENGEIDLRSEHVKFCVSWFTMHVAHIGTSIFVAAWNEHRIPGSHKGIPNVLMSENNQAKAINPSLIPEVDDAVQMYQTHGGQINLFGDFGIDPLLQRKDLSNLREQRFFEQYASFDNIFHTVVNNDNTLFRNGLLYFIDVSMQLEAQL